MQSGHLIALSVLAAGAMIGAGLYFGLRAQSPAVPTTTPTSSPVSSSSPTVEVTAIPASPSAPPQTSASPSPATPRDGVANEVRAALDPLRPALVKECWAPSAAKDAEPASLGFDYRIAIGPQGNVVAHSVNDVAAASRADVARCLRDRKLDLKVPPPGSSVVVTGTLKLP